MEISVYSIFVYVRIEKLWISKIGKYVNMENVNMKICGFKFVNMETCEYGNCKYG